VRIKREAGRAVGSPGRPVTRTPAARASGPVLAWGEQRVMESLCGLSGGSCHRAAARQAIEAAGCPLRFLLAFA